MTIEKLRDYHDRLSRHDWTYMYSDDHYIYRRGADAESALRHEAAMSPEHKKLWDAWKAYGQRNPGDLVKRPAYPMRYLCDNARHMVCEPFSIENLHTMAASLGIGKFWYHKSKFPHYDMPKRRIAELTAKCELVTQKEILCIIKGTSNG